MPGTPQPVPIEHGNKGLTRQAEFTEYPVHDKGDPGHIAAGLQEGQEEEQHQHLGHKAQHCAHTGNNTIQNQALDSHSAQPTLEARKFSTRSDPGTLPKAPSAEQNIVGPVW